jgi:hypothetical protein
MVETRVVHVRCNRCGVDYPGSDRVVLGVEVVGSACHVEVVGENRVCGGTLEEIDD